LGPGDEGGIVDTVAKVMSHLRELEERRAADG
jgi:hypothetical protein